MLKITLLDVGNGDSIVLEHGDDGRSRFGVIDSNRLSVHAEPRALTYLRSKQVADLSFLALTHPHWDHLNGLPEIVEHYKNRIGLALMYPLPTDPVRQEKLAQQYIKLAQNSDGQERYFAVSFLKFFMGVREYAQVFEVADSLSSEVFCSDFTNGKFKIFSILPAKDLKGSYFHDIGKNALKFGDPTQNDLSFALSIEYAGVSIILGGDASAKSWAKRKRRVGGDLGATVAKLPHHGAKEDCSPEILQYIYGERAMPQPVDAFALISAAGRTHPHPDVLASLKNMAIKPFCTSRATICGASTVRDLVTAHRVDQKLLKDINSRSTTTTRNGPCQGDITVEISTSGDVMVTPAFNTPCGFR